MNMFTKIINRMNRESVGFAMTTFPKVLCGELSKEYGIQFMEDFIHVTEGTKDSLVKCLELKQQGNLNHRTWISTIVPLYVNSPLERYGELQAAIRMMNNVGQWDDEIIQDHYLKEVLPHMDNLEPAINVLSAQIEYFKQIHSDLKTK